MSAAAVIAACTVGGAALAPRLPLAQARPAYDPREVQQPPADRLEAIDPLSLLAGWAKEPDPVMFTVAAPRAERWRLAVLDRYDPATGWSTDGELLPAGEDLPAGDAPPTATETLVQEVTIESLPGVWLPAADRPISVTGVDPLVEVSTGVLAQRGALAPGLRYRVVSAVPATEPDCSTAAAGPLTAADAASPLPPDLVELTQELTRGVTSPCARAHLLEDYLSSDDFEFNTEAPSGATIGRIRDLLQPRDGPGLGTSEQFATAFALMARATGLPARVVVGFHGGERVGDSYEVRAGDAFAWAEVRFAGLGWVAFDPTPVPGDQSPPPEVAEEEVESDPGSDDGPTAPSTPQPVEQEVPAPQRDAPPSTWGRAARVSLIGVAVVAVAVVALAAATTLVRRIRRHRRASAGDPARRVLGAWRQCLEELREAGVEPEPARTASEYVARSRSTIGEESAEAVAPVARLANGVLFGGPPVSDDDAAAAWRCADRLSEITAERRSTGDALRRALDVRTLVRR